MSAKPDLLFLPGAGGDPAFWSPVANTLPADWRKTRLGWPGLGDQPHDPAIGSLNDLVMLAERNLPHRAIVVAQSMGGIVAMRLALRHPDRITHLVLTATSGGIPLDEFGVTDWRPGYRAAHPHAAPWIQQASADHTRALPNVQIPTLLLWGDADPISPVAVGQRLGNLLPRARLEIISGGGHDLAQTHAAEVAALIGQHIG